MAACRICNKEIELKPGKNICFYCGDVTNV